LSTNPPDIVIFAEILAYLPLRTQILYTTVELKDPRPVLIGSGDQGKRETTYISLPGMEWASWPKIGVKKGIRG